MEESQKVYIAGVGWVDISNATFDKMYDYSWRLLFCKECFNMIPVVVKTIPDIVDKLYWYTLN